MNFIYDEFIFQFHTFQTIMQNFFLLPLILMLAHLTPTCEALRNLRSGIGSQIAAGVAGTAIGVVGAHLFLGALKGNKQKPAVQAAINENSVVENTTVQKDPNPTPSTDNNALQLENDKLKLQLENHALRQQINDIQQGSS